MRDIVKVLRHLEKYQAIKQNNSTSPQTRAQIEKKIPQFERALETLRARKRTMAFGQGLEKFRSPNQKGDITFNISSSSKEYSLYNDPTFQHTRTDDHFSQNIKSIQESSFANSVKTLFDSMKTDNYSKQSDQTLFREFKQNSLVNNEKLVNEKLHELEKKIEGLRY